MDLMKKWLVVVVIVLFSAGLAQARTATPKKSRSTNKPAQTKVKAVPEDPYKAFIVVEARSGKVLEGENVHLKRAPASVVKLMVACVVMEKLAKGEVKLTDTITVTREASKMGGSQVYLKEGETFTLEEMMKAVLVASGNDAAYAVAEHLAGTKEAFIKLMNEKAKALNMTDTEFHSVHGLPPSKGESEDQSSCSDLAILARELVRYPKLLEWTSIKTAGFRNGLLVMNNHNKLLFRLPGVDGLKTGYYRETGFNVVATAQKNDLRFIVVVLGSPKARTRDDLAAEKFKKAFAQYKTIPVVKKGETVDKEVILTEAKIGKIKGVAGADFLYPIPNDQKDTFKKEPVLAEKVKGEIKQGQKLGELVIKLDNQVVGKVDIVSTSSVPKANFFTIILRKIGIGS
jgi:serine-type D-Ala-D-Ala carboxypeptidase (penicillin-binding protein 5/6)